MTFTALLVGDPNYAGSGAGVADDTSQSGGGNGSTTVSPIPRASGPTTTLHTCRFGFTERTFDRIGNSIDGGTSLSGYTDEIETSGGGWWQYTLASGLTRDADAGREWRGVAEYLAGKRAVDVLVCERLFQPNQAGTHRHGLDPLTDGTEYPVETAYAATDTAVLRATSLKITSTVFGRRIQSGNVFGIRHPTWGWRCYRISLVASDGTVSFGPPLREAVPAGTFLDFDNPRCRMYAPQAPSVPVSLGRSISCALTMVEDMRQPS